MSNYSRTNSHSVLTRRQLLRIPMVITLAGNVATDSALAAERPKIAVITTVYRRPTSHSAWIAGRLLEGYDYNGKRHEPRLEVVSMYTDQVPESDMSREKAAMHGFTIYPTVREALMLGGNDLAVDGVVFIGEHGDYHTNIKGQKYYPRWYLYRQIIDVFRKTGRAVPVFNDKHLSVEWNEAKWMYNQSRELGFPMMAGSSLPVAYRDPQLELELETPIERAVALHYGGKESYGFHGLEVLQCMMERRRGGETGVAAVQCLEGKDEVWKWTDANPWAERLLNECLKRCPERKPGNPRDYVRDPILFILEYRDGVRALVYSLRGNDLRSWAFAADIQGKKEPVSTQFWTSLFPQMPSGSSGFVHYIEELIITGRESYPVERTLLITGALAAFMDSNYENGNHLLKGRRLETPYLNMTYRAPKEPLYNRGPRPVLTTGETW